MTIAHFFKKSLGVLALASLAYGMGACSGSANEEEPVAASDDKADADDSSTAEKDLKAAEAQTVHQTAPAASAAPAATAASTDGNRVIRFVSVAAAKLHNQPRDGAETIGSLLKGQAVLVVEDNGWGRISDGAFIRLDQVSAKAVSPDRQPAVWHAPSH